MTEDEGPSVYGVQQFKDGTWEKLDAGTFVASHAATVRAGAEYMKARYGEGAWSAETNFGWYDKGGLIPPAPEIIHNNTGADQMVVGWEYLKRKFGRKS